MKLQAAGLDIRELPAAFADDSISREDIVKTAVSRAKAFYHQPDFERIVCIGDGIWDVLTAMALQLPFVGVASDTQKLLLENAGVNCIIPDFIDFESFLKAVRLRLTQSCPMLELLTQNILNLDFRA